jgi:hypothetical protein
MSGNVKLAAIGGIVRKAAGELMKAGASESYLEGLIDSALEDASFDVDVRCTIGRRPLEQAVFHVVDPDDDTVEQTVRLSRVYVARVYAPSSGGDDLVARVDVREVEEPR